MTFKCCKVVQIGVRRFAEFRLSDTVTPVTLAFCLHGTARPLVPDQDDEFNGSLSLSRLR
jgi:hypothetical protein